MECFSPDCINSQVHFGRSYFAIGLDGVSQYADDVGVRVKNVSVHFIAAERPDKGRACELPSGALLK
jgi:hypothetical protein